MFDIYGHPLYDIKYFNPPNWNHEKVEHTCNGTHFIIQFIYKLSKVEWKLETYALKWLIFFYPKTSLSAVYIVFETEGSRMYYYQEWIISLSLKIGQINVLINFLLTCTPCDSYTFINMSKCLVSERRVPSWNSSSMELYDFPTFGEVMNQ